NGQEKEEDEVGNLQLAWEMLEVAKVIYKRKEGKDDQLMAAQAYLKLGEVSAESGNYPQALEDFQQCLALQLKHLPPHSRLLAETHYHVATTLCYMDQYNQAIQHYNSSITVIEARLAMLQEAIGAAEEKNEMEELKQLLPDIREKVEDAKESQRTASAASQAIQQTLGGASTSSAFLCENGSPSSAFASASQIPVKSCGGASPSKAVSNISHLVRKKRKPEEESPVKDTDAKQAKQEATVNGADSSASNGVQEGKSQEPASGGSSA
ncbi:nuclear autoantigenic sperm protein, partial [Anarrhichthys ocellatus]|uniref:nuclear autoantigenic sperm protein n=1 Tax=Anarrhichthys ocellatus TaxID=433405 RepID=UPI0012ED34F1